MARHLSMDFNDMGKLLPKVGDYIRLNIIVKKNIFEVEVTRLAQQDVKSRKSSKTGRNAPEETP